MSTAREWKRLLDKKNYWEDKYNGLLIEYRILWVMLFICFIYICLKD